MATKDRKTQVRIDPALAIALKKSAVTEGVPSYKLLEMIIKGWLSEHRPELVTESREDPPSAVDDD